MGVAVDDGADRLAGYRRLHQLPRRLRGLRRGQGIDDDEGLLRLDERDHREVHAARLIDAPALLVRRDLEQAVEVVERRVAPQAGIDRVRRRLVAGEEFVLVQIPHDIALRILDDARRRGDEAVAGGRETLLVVLEDRALGHVGVELDRVRRRRLRRLQRPQHRHLGFAVLAWRARLAARAGCAADTAQQALHHQLRRTFHGA